MMNVGINLTETFSRRTTHLLCPTREGPKFAKALEWNIPVVDMKWLTDIAISGQVDIAPDHRSESVARRKQSVVSPTPPSVKGKERALDQPKEDPDTDSKSGVMCLLKGIRSSKLSAKQLLQSQIPEGQFDHSRQSSPLGDDDHLEPFGQPVDLLLQEQPQLPPRDPASEVDEPFTLSSSSPLGDESVHPEMSLAELRADMQNTRIPSSASPSPIKVRSNPTSPVKVSREASKMLQESITSLLGKRMSTEDTGNGHSARPKRPRAPPPRDKVNNVRNYPQVC